MLIKEEDILMLNENVKRLLKDHLWDLATSGENEPNVVPVGFKDITEEGNLSWGMCSWRPR